MIEKSYMEERYNKDSIEDFMQPEGGRDLSSYEKFFDFRKEDLEGEKILDLGAGPEVKFEKGLKEAGINAEVISLSPDFSINRHRNKASASLPNARLVAGLGQELPFQEKSFDKIFAYHVAEHVSGSDFDEIVFEIGSALRDGGRAYIGPLIMDDYIRIFENDTIKKILEEDGISAKAEVLPPEIMRPQRLYDDNGVPVGEAKAIKIIMEKKTKIEK